MKLSNNLLYEFAKISNNKPDRKKETITNGTTVEQDGVMFVRLDGSNLLTPVLSTADTRPGERVIVMIKNHTATITGNMSSPAARTEDVENIELDVDSKIAPLAERIDVFDKTLTTNTDDIDNLQKNIQTITDILESQEERFTEIEETLNSRNNEINTIKETLSSQNNEITTIKETLDIYATNFETITDNLRTLGEEIAALREVVEGLQNGS